MKKWIALMALTTAASSALATSLYEPFNYFGTTNPNTGATWADGDPLSIVTATAATGAPDTSEVPNSAWYGLRLPGTAGTSTIQWHSALTANTPSSMTYSGLAYNPANPGGTSPSSVGYVTAREATGIGVRDNLNASYGPSSTIYYSMLLQVPTNSNWASSFGGNQGGLLAGLQFLDTQDTQNEDESTYSGTTNAASLAIRGDDESKNPLGNGPNGHEQFELGVGFSNVTRNFEQTPLEEGVTYLIVVGLTRPGDSGNYKNASESDVATLYIDPVSTSFGTNTPGVSTVLESDGVTPLPPTVAADPGANNGGTRAYGYSAGGSKTLQDYLGNLNSLFIANQSTQTTFPNQGIDLTDARVDSSFAGVTGLEWTSSSDSTWGTAGNWTNGQAPNAAGASVTFGTGSTVQNVSLSSAKTVGAIQFNSTNSYTVGSAGGSTITLAENNLADPAMTVQQDGTLSVDYYNMPAASYNPSTVQVTAGSHAINAPLMLSNNTLLGVASGSKLTIGSVSTSPATINVNYTSGYGYNYTGTYSAAVSLAVRGGGTVEITPASATALQGLAGSMAPLRGLAANTAAGTLPAGTNLGLIGNVNSTNTNQGDYGLSVQDGSTLKIDQKKAVITTNGFYMDSSSKLDLTNNDLIVTYNDVLDFAATAAAQAGDATDSSPHPVVYDLPDTTTGPAVVAAVISGYSQGTWNGNGITSSMASLPKGTTLGVVDNGTLATPLTTVDGVNVGAGTLTMPMELASAGLAGEPAMANVTSATNTVIVKYTWLGDANLDGVVTGADMSMMSPMGTTVTDDNNWAEGDFNYDGVVNADDLSLYMLGAAESAGANINAVPEPALSMVAIGIGFVMGIRRRKIK